MLTSYNQVTRLPVTFVMHNVCAINKMIVIQQQLLLDVKGPAKNNHLTANTPIVTCIVNNEYLQY